MATIRKGNKAALLVVDVQVGVMKNVWEPPRIIDNLEGVVNKARYLGVPVIWVQHADGDLPHGSPEWQIVPLLVPAQGEILIEKKDNSSFEGTTLEQELKALEVTHIVLGGAATNWCIRATAYAALERGYDLTLLKDAHTTESMEMQDGTCIPAEYIINELNIVMTWLTYPGRKCGTASIEEIDFNKPGGVG